LAVLIAALFVLRREYKLTMRGKRKRRVKMTTNAPQRAGETNDPYSLAKILGLWVAAALPMALLGWVAHPALVFARPYWVA